MTTSKRICPRKKGGPPLFNALAIFLMSCSSWCVSVPGRSQQIFPEYWNTASFFSAIHQDDFRVGLVTVQTVVDDERVLFIQQHRVGVLSRT